MTDLAVFISFVHSIITLVLGDNFARIFDNNLVRLKRTVTAYTMSTIKCFYDLDTNVISASVLTSLTQSFKTAIGAVISTNVTVGIITFVEHGTVEAVFTATSLRCANTGRRLKEFGFLPYICSVPNEHI